MRVCVLKNADFVTDAFHNLPLCVTEVLRGAFGLVWRALCSLGWGELPRLCYVPLSSMAVKSLERSRSESKAEHFSRQSTFFFSIFFFFQDVLVNMRQTMQPGRGPALPSAQPQGAELPPAPQSVPVGHRSPAPPKGSRTGGHRDPRAFPSTANSSPGNLAPATKPEFLSCWKK